MKEKERYEIHIYDDICVDLFDKGVLDKSINDTYKLEELLNQQDKKISDLEARLAEKEKQLENAQNLKAIEVADELSFKLSKIDKQDKISFCIEKLKNVKKLEEEFVHLHEEFVAKCNETISNLNDVMDRLKKK